MDRFFTVEDYAYVDRQPGRQRFEVIDSTTNKTVGVFTGGNARERADAYETQRREGHIRS